MSLESLIFRVATAADAAGVGDLFARSYPALLAADYPPVVLQRALPILTAVQPDLLASGGFWLAFEDDSLRAAGGWTRVAPGRGGVETPELGHIRHVAADPEQTRRGIASALLGAVIADAAAQGMARLDCLSTLTAAPFYARLGFVEQARFDLLLGPDCPFGVVRMQRNLRG